MNWIFCCRDLKTNKVFPDENRTAKRFSSPNGKLGIGPRATALVLAERQPNILDAASQSQLPFEPEDWVEVNVQSTDNESPAFQAVRMVLPVLEDLRSLKGILCMLESKHVSCILYCAL